MLLLFQFPNNLNDRSEYLKSENLKRVRVVLQREVKGVSVQIHYYNFVSVEGTLQSGSLDYGSFRLP